ncbi:MAG TPA: hypothetical protein VGZ28_15320 [Terriglobales bacterium]|jgi:hypothetical protein|nr:hypothetical protein [Terriglobales bacterium]
MATSTITENAAGTFPAMGAGRLLVFGGIALIAVGMLFGDIFAVFVLHQNGAQTGEALLAATQAVTAKDPAAVKTAFARIGNAMEDRGTKVDTHVHMIDAGYLALLLALIQPYVALSAARKKLLAKLFLTGGVLLPTGIFLIHYVGLAYSPSTVIGWASILADSAGALLIITLLGEGWGFWSYLRSKVARSLEPELPRNRTWERRTLRSGGTVLVLLGFLQGAWYAGMNLYEHEARETKILGVMLDSAAAGDATSAGQSVNHYGALQGEKAVQIAAHSHIIEFGLLAILLSFVQPYVFLSERWKRIWIRMLLAGSVILPVFVLLELKMGLLAGGIADIGGLMVIVALAGMLVGVVRYSGSLDAEITRVR